ncbi:anthranilate synthase component II [Parvicella tangerina]|uniref:Aminodeoxychorismate/anthranilate synthase component 2 n=1 Tax=Parvicella tangerina TaxID=2829795 RepID=A0A916JN96_9FLAO|nr:aminodeoxychorismate/anthranilate synthase component II [Parvicella tangerina]CAG5082432.1 Aminodeoxychorismate/anthranilate synthase component 2 [Parvicella tangerina]
MKTVIIDNYDSFTYNLVHYIEEANGVRPTVFRNDELTLSQLDQFDVIVLSPGPGLPSEANLMMDIIAAYVKRKIMLGVCLGHQAIAQHFGCELKNLEKVYHGVSSFISITKQDEMHQNYKGLEVGRYHSWVVDRSNFSPELIITSEDQDGQIMSFRHKELPVFGIQYHPESVLTPKGKELLSNFFTYWRSNSQSFVFTDK